MDLQQPDNQELFIATCLFKDASSIASFKMAAYKPRRIQMRTCYVGLLLVRKAVYDDRWKSIGGQLARFMQRLITNFLS